MNVELDDLVALPLNSILDTEYSINEKNYINCQVNFLFKTALLSSNTAYKASGGGQTVWGVLSQLIEFSMQQIVTSCQVA